MRRLRVMARKMSDKDDRETLEWAVDFIEMARREVSAMNAFVERLKEASGRMMAAVNEFKWNTDDDPSWRV